MRFKVGNGVCLKIGGPLMAVINVHAGRDGLRLVRQPRRGAPQALPGRGAGTGNPGGAAACGSPLVEGVNA